MPTADCHCHSTHSDGALSPKELIELGTQNQLTGLSITDHDCIDAYKESIHTQANTIQMISGVELSTMFEGTPIHVLGYSFNIKDRALNQLCQMQQQNKHNRNIQIIQKLKRYGFDIDYEQCQAHFAPQKNIGRPHIAQYLVHLNLIANEREAFKKYLGNDSCCFVKGEFIDCLEAIQTLQNAGGVAVIAHPHMLKKPKVFKKLICLPFDGIEVYYGNLPANQHVPWLKVAKEKNWLVLGGSDYHGHANEYKTLGVSTTPDEVFEALYQRFLLSNSAILVEG